MWPKSIMDAAKLVYNAVIFPGLDNYFREVLQPFATWVVSGGLGSPDKQGGLLLGWRNANMGQFQNLVFLCQTAEKNLVFLCQTAEKESSNVGPESTEQFWWLSVRESLISQFFPGRVVDGAFLALLEEVRILLCWKWGLWDASTDNSFAPSMPEPPRQDPRTFVLQPDQLQVDPETTGEGVELPPVPELPFDQDDQ
jgi:hypothetical protein